MYNKRDQAEKEGASKAINKTISMMENAGLPISVPSGYPSDRRDMAIGQLVDVIEQYKAMIAQLTDKNKLYRGYSNE